MSFRRLPFQFTTTDPVERHLELEKRFGLPTANNMYVDAANPLSMVTGNRDLSSSSPRLQHRVPIFVEGYDQPVKASVDSTNAHPEKKSNVRIIPIEVEGIDAKSSRHRTFSGPAGLVKKENEYLSCREETSPLKRSMQDLTKPIKVKATDGQRVHNIPIQIEGRDFCKGPAIPEKIAQSSKKNHIDQPINGCTISKSTNKVKSPEKQSEPDYSVLLKKIESVLEELKYYESGVQEFNGSAKDKQYRYLDEMLTRCMLRLDDIDTLGNENVRSARKNAVKKVQACIDLLETKVAPQLEAEKEKQMEINEIDKDVEMKEIPSKDSEPSIEKVYEKQSQSEASDDQESCEIEMEDKEKSEIIGQTKIENKTESSELTVNTNEVEMADSKEVKDGVLEAEVSENVSSPQTDVLESNEVEMVDENKNVSNISSNKSQISVVFDEKQDLPVLCTEVKSNDFEIKDIALDKQNKDNLQEELNTEVISISHHSGQPSRQDQMTDNSIADETKRESERASEDVLESSIKFEKLLPEYIDVLSTNISEVNTSDLPNENKSS